MGCCKRRGSAGHMHDAGTGEVDEAKITQRIHTEYRVTTPGPAAFQRINEAGQHYGEGKKSPQLHAFSYCTRDNRHGSRNKYDLEIEVRSRRICCRFLGTSYAISGNA